ncbi:MAG: PHP domain-containing protein, partial [Clostridiales Family XIII bacterium]|nr:PHP domain-containing protein [Clostridiales Family XIII bacterium]
AEGGIEAGKAGIDLIPGIEITADSEREQHILGYFFDIDEVALSRMRKTLLDMRRERVSRVLAYLNGLGVSIDFEEIAARREKAYIGRPHIAEAVVRAGRARDIREVFERYFTGADFRRADRPRPSARESIEMIRAAGGAASLAHPHTLRLSNEDLERAIEKLQDLGLTGLECHYGTYERSVRDAYCRIAEKRGLAITGGSDFHGPVIRPGVEIGTGYKGLLDFNDLGVAERLRAVTFS